MHSFLENCCDYSRTRSTTARPKETGCAAVAAACFYRRSNTKVRIPKKPRPVCDFEQSTFWSFVLESVCLIPALAVAVGGVRKGCPSCPCSSPYHFWISMS
ncbi:hypothetical protein Naga_100023g3 [Nannochloropsis gaditana]|uniref:Uncharacterized protein n=1 Tax=Nannochloropsis gaditana TaxID=72520 RepID=W7T6H6_9STRA|nr:hypothetical protein Naga_100023g3 [Nannochloropsis gaditana]